MMVFINTISHYEAFAVWIVLKCTWSQARSIFAGRFNFYLWPHIPLFLAWFLTLLGFLMLSKYCLIYNLGVFESIYIK